jgi:hypothetical protein
VEAVENQTDVRVIGLLDDLPRLAVPVHMPAPGQGFEADAQVTPGGALGQLAQLRGGPLRIAERQWRRVGAHQHQRRAQLLHQIELALGTIEAAPEWNVRHALEIAERLVTIERQPEIGGHAGHRFCAAGELNEIILEKLEAVEARCGDRLQLLAQGAAERHGGDRSVHQRSLHAER